MNLVVTGHVDHGKSTIVGRLLADTNSLPEGKLAAVRAYCAKNAKPFEYAFLLDALRAERAQGITIDTGRVFFKSASREYILIDAPGHSEFLRNMITGAARAEAALLVIDAREGVRENSRRHGYLLSMLGIRQIAVVVNKMDLVDWSQPVFDAVTEEFGAFLATLGVRASGFIPASGMSGENIVERSAALDWYGGLTVLEALDAFVPESAPGEAPFRMPVQGVYKFTANGDQRRIVAGTIAAGQVRLGDELVFLPSGKTSRVATIEAFSRELPMHASAGEATGVTLTDHIYVNRGEIAVRADQPPVAVSTRLRASVFWLGREPLVSHKEYGLKLGSANVPVQLEAVHRVLDTSTLEPAGGGLQIERHQVADCTLVATRPLAFDTAETLGLTSRFVLVDRFQIAGGGVIRESLPDRQAWVREKVIRRESKWARSRIADERRAERYSQKPSLLIITGAPAVDRKGLALTLEERLFDEGRLVYFLGIGNLLYGVDADIERNGDNRDEHLRRLGEVANILLDTGLIVIATAVSLGQADLDLVRTAAGADRVWTAWLGDDVTTDLTADVVIAGAESTADGARRLKQLLRDQGLIFSLA